MQQRLACGIPSVSEYKVLIDSDEYKMIERFSDEFLTANKIILKGYSQRWVKDPLHQWSRQWEYPFILSNLNPIAKNLRAARILDAGSGVTFLPFYIKKYYQSSEVYCVDNDDSLEDIYHRINSLSDNNVIYSCCDIRELPYENNWFDVVYCISVLEHTDNYVEIIDEFKRILRYGGKLLITFDVSLDGTRDISVEKSGHLLKSLITRFDVDSTTTLDIESYVTRPDIFTTLSAKDIDSRLLPWKLPSIVYQLKALITNAKFISWPPQLSVFCLVLTKTEK